MWITDYTYDRAATCSPAFINGLVQMEGVSFPSFFSLALGSPSDVIYIEKLVADEAHLPDAKDFRGLANIFAKNATYNAGGASPNVYGIESIQTKLASVLGPGSSH